MTRRPNPRTARPAGVQPSSGPTWQDALRLVSAVLAFIVLAWLVRTHAGAIEGWLTGLGAWAPLAFVLVHAVVVPLGFPVSVLGVLAGATFGWLVGTLVMLVAGLVSASIMYGLARSLLAGWILRWTGRRPRLARMLELARRDSWRLMILLRLSPLHYGTVSYLLGAARVRYGPYLVTGLLVLPSAGFQAYLGHAARVVGQDVAAPGQVAIGRVVMLVGGLVATALLTVLLGRMARRALEEDHDGPQTTDEDDAR
jgi:uncharacterized membrane protein YdjX (TVP38/TMEM64 family)